MFGFFLHPAQQMALSQQRSLQCRYRAACAGIPWDPAVHKAHVPRVPMPTADVKPFKYLGRYNCKLQIGALPVQGF